MPGRKQSDLYSGIRQGSDCEAVEEMKVGDLIKMLQEDGWFHVRTRGSHRQFYHSTKTGVVTVAGRTSKDLPPGTLNAILKQAGLK